MDKLLQYHELPESDTFVLAVSQRVARQHRLRQVVLMLSGVVGAAFGLLGMYLLAEPLAPLLSQWLAVDTTAASGLVLFLVVVMLAWLLHDEPGLSV